MNEEEFQELEKRYTTARENRRVLRRINYWKESLHTGRSSQSLKILIEDDILEVLSDEYINDFLAGIEDELLRQEEKLKEEK